MAKEIIYLTAEGYKKLKEELDHMRSVERPAISAAIAEARDKGDLSENAEYDAAREAQGLLEMRIAKMEDTLANARVIDETKIDKSKVQILSKVTLLNKNNGKQVTYTIVAEHEANLREGKLAIGTPIAKALLGHKKDEVVEVNVPAGTIHFEILDISILTVRTTVCRPPHPLFTGCGGRRFREEAAECRTEARIAVRAQLAKRTHAQELRASASGRRRPAALTCDFRAVRSRAEGPATQRSSPPPGGGCGLPTSARPNHAANGGAQTCFQAETCRAHALDRCVPPRAEAAARRTKARFHTARPREFPQL